MEKSYDPKQVETRWYQTWSERDYFMSTDDPKKEPYCIVIPPPNITGSLHMGHALNNTLQDILIRWRRMQGRNALWVPGTDHAGIATQNVVEKQLMAEGTSRKVLGRDAFIKRVWEWKAQSGGTIIQQLKRLGSSCDWDRLLFTMDEGPSKAVREVFVKLYDDKLLYRDNRLINWCPRCLTALSDIEVEHEDVTGKLYTIRYPLHDHPEKYLSVATTRPETMLGDAAVAIHPDDNRYRDFRGKLLTLPLTTRTIPVVEDPILVDPEIGTGAVKITPAHDFNDEAAGKRHGLQRKLIMDIHARLDSIKLKTIAHAEDVVVQALGRLPREKARVKIEQLLSERGLLEKVENHKMALGKCYRCKTVVEPYPSTQWFVKIQPLADPAIKVVEDGDIKIIPEGWKNNYLGWMRDIKDWCISRQIWWGHRIPAWYCRACVKEDELTATIPDEQWRPSPDTMPVVARTEPVQCPKCGKKLIQDPDVLDTWFSSALWPFSTLGWPEQTPDLKKFYPTTTLVTGLDILFFWVARMIMMGLYCKPKKAEGKIKDKENIPFRNVYIHALVRDAEGQKMSKSKGNVIDPLAVMDKYGTDALRFTLASMASPGRDIKLSEERIEGYRNFANKLWNAARFILINLEGPRANAPVAERPVADRWILSRLHRCIGEVNTSLEAYRFDEAANTLYHFIWHEYCDWYVELSKPALTDKTSYQATLTRTTLIESFETLLRLLHPFMPFITEEIWQAIPHAGESIMVAPYPSQEKTFIDAAIEQEIEGSLKVIAGIREIRGAQAIAPSKELSVTVATPSSAFEQSLRNQQALIASLSTAGTLIIGTDIKHPASAAITSIVFPGGSIVEVGVDLAGLIDVGKEKARIEKRLKELTAQLEQDKKKLSNPDFVAKVPPDVLKKTKARHEECRTEHEKLTNEVQRLRAMAGGA